MTKDRDDLPYVMGGIGDVLQCFESAIAARHVRVYSHFRRAGDLLTPHGVEVEFHYFNAATWPFVRPSGAPLARQHFPALCFSRPVKEDVRGGYASVVGVHPIGSALSSTLLRAMGRPTKSMSDGYIVGLYAFLRERSALGLLFCSPDHRAAFESLLASAGVQNARVVAEPQIWDSLRMVSCCDLVVGVDSAIKTVSAMLRIPTIVLVDDNPDPFRDTHFIRPYVDAGVMDLIRFARGIGIDELRATEEAILARWGGSAPGAGSARSGLRR